MRPLHRASTYPTHPQFYPGPQTTFNLAQNGKGIIPFQLITRLTRRHHMCLYEVSDDCVQLHTVRLTLVFKHLCKQVNLIINQQRLSSGQKMGAPYFVRNEGTPYSTRSLGTYAKADMRWLRGLARTVAHSLRHPEADQQLCCR